MSSYHRGTRIVKMGEGFFRGYRQTIIEPDELLVSLNIPHTSNGQFVVAYKQAKRREDDIAIVNMAINVMFETKTDIVTDIRISFGGMAATVLMAPKSCSLIIGKRWNRKTVEVFSDSLIKELPISPSAPGGMILYRRSLTLSLFFKAFLQISSFLEKCGYTQCAIPDNEKSGAHLFHTLMPKSNQVFQKYPGRNAQVHALKQPRVHTSALKQASGEAVYLNDIPKIENELYLALVLSTKAHATIIAIDASEALLLSGVHGFVSSKDLTSEQNAYGPIVKDEEIFISSKVTSQGQVIGAIVADNQYIAKKAALLVRVEYEDISPVIITIEDAIAHKAFFNEGPKEIHFGNISEGFENAEVIVKGKCRIGGQEHFYFETQSCLAIPREGDEMEIFCSSQHLTSLQSAAARVLGVPASKVVTRAKRIGGGFGGRESRFMLVALPVVIAAQLFNRPVRCVLDRDEDMAITGGRHPFHIEYKAGASRDGRLTALELDMYSNGGCTKDFSMAVSFNSSHFIQ